jgi:hypothetical protein
VQPPHLAKTSPRTAATNSDSASATLFRQRFRQRCQDAMSRQRQQALAQARARTGSKSRGSDMFRSDEISGSEDEQMDDDVADMPAWQREDDEVSPSRAPRRSASAS